MVATNRFYAENDTLFEGNCKKAGQILFPEQNDKAEEFSRKIRTTRQASKFRRGEGIVYKTITGKP